MKWLINLIVSSMIFLPDKEFDLLPPALGLEYEDVYCTASDGVRISGWFFPVQSPKATLVFFHGNAGNISYRLEKAKGWIDRGVSVFLIDYRGFGKSEGKIRKEADLYSDAEAALRWLRENKNILPPDILLHGESIGSGPAIELGCRETFRGIILEAPLTSLLELARKYYPWVSARLLGDFKILNLEKIPDLKAPLFVLHGEDDEICPFAMGERLTEAAPVPKKLLSVPGGHHNDLIETAGEVYFEGPFQFFFGNPDPSAGK